MVEEFDKFTANALNLLAAARKEADRFKRNEIEPEHLLLGLIQGEDSVAVAVLKRSNIDLVDIIRQLEHIIGDREIFTINPLGLSRGSKKVVELAVDEARRMNHHYIGTEHFLLGLLREGQNMAADVLYRSGVGIHETRALVVELSSQMNPTRLRRPIDRYIEKLRHDLLTLSKEDFELVLAAVIEISQLPDTIVRRQE